MERYRTTLIMLVLLVALGIAAFALNNNGAGTEATPTAVPVRYVWESTDQVNGLDIVSGTQKVVLQNDVAADSWVLKEPVSGPADTFSVSSIADSFKSLQARSVLTDSSKLADFGLDKQGLTVTTTFSGTTSPKTILVGGPTFDGAGYYVKTPDAATVYVVSNSTIEPLKSWLATPPVAPPTATPPQLTIAPTATDTPPIVATATTTQDAGTLPTSSVITGTTTLTSTESITSTSPGAANPTTPLPALSPSP